MQVDLYFDYISPFAFFGWRNLFPLAQKYQAEVRLHPVVFGALLSHWGQLGPAEIPPKRVYTFKTVVRYAALHKIELRGPAQHPFNPLAALRMTLAAGERMPQVAQVLWDAIWVDGVDGGDPEALVQKLSQAGQDGPGLWAKAQTPAIKAELKSNTDAAIQRGVFGVPTFAVGEELFWGNDSLEWVALALQGKDPLDMDKVQHLVNRPRGTDRRQMQR